MRALLDGDILLYEIGFSSQQVVDGEVVPNSWEFCADLLDGRIAFINDEVEATEPPLLFLTNTRRINKILNKQRKREEAAPKEYVENFRVAAAEEKDYKGGRKAEKPYHFYNLLVYMLSKYDVHIDENGLEADDAICVHQTKRLKEGFKDTIICSRDKDLRQCEGFHYSWEVGRQASIGPIYVEPMGWLEHKNVGERDAKGKLKPAKIFGTGHKFFYYQMLVGDAVDNIGGIKGKGPVFGYELIKDITTEREGYELVAEKYVQAWGDLWKEKMKEQALLLWMVREIDENGDKVFWRPPRRLTEKVSGSLATPTSSTTTSSDIPIDHSPP